MRENPDDVLLVVMGCDESGKLCGRKRCLLASSSAGVFVRISFTTYFGAQGCHKCLIFGPTVFAHEVSVVVISD